MKSASEDGAPVMRPLFYDFENDLNAWEVDDAYMFGPDILVAPIMEEGICERSIYLPEGVEWMDAYTGQKYFGGSLVTVPAPINVIPVLVRADKAEDPLLKDFVQYYHM